MQQHATVRNKFTTEQASYEEKKIKLKKHTHFHPFLQIIVRK